MKKIIFPIIALVLATFGFQGCKPEPEGELGTPFNLIEGMNGTWYVSKFSQVDLNNPLQEERDLSDFFAVPNIDERMKITFNTSDRTFNVTPGAGKNYLINNGSWGFDDDSAPGKLFLYGTSDTLEVIMSRMIRTFDNTLGIELQPRSCTTSGTTLNTVIYKYEFTRQ